MLLDLESVKATDMCLAVGAALTQSVNGVIGLVRGLSEGVGPTSEKIKTFTLLYKIVVKQCEFFVPEVEPPAAKEKNHVQEDCQVQGTICTIASVGRCIIVTGKSSYLAMCASACLRLGVCTITPKFSLTCSCC